MAMRYISLTRHSQLKAETGDDVPRNAISFQKSNQVRKWTLPIAAIMGATQLGFQFSETYILHQTSFPGDHIHTVSNDYFLVFSHSNNKTWFYVFYLL